MKVLVVPPPPFGRLTIRALVLIGLAGVAFTIGNPWGFVLGIVLGWLGPRMFIKTWIEAVQGCDELWEQAIKKYEQEQVASGGLPPLVFPNAQWN